LDSSILIAPLVFFISPNDPRFQRTIDRILLPLEKGGLTSAGLVYRYNTEKSLDGNNLPKYRSNSLHLLLLTGQVSVDAKAHLACAPFGW
jgi:GH15 family glucan-1,4-alpha-glucosidase